MPRESRIPPVFRSLIVAVVYFGGAELGLSLASLHSNVTAVWPPTGIAIASLLIFGRTVWPGIFVGALAANLLTNIPVLSSVKFTSTGGVVDVYLERHDSLAEIRIEDSGPGIPQDFLPRIFERFSQADGSSTRKHGGLGLGLAIVRHLIELHGGTVSASNRSDQQGAVLTVRLPAVV